SHPAVQRQGRRPFTRVAAPRRSCAPRQRWSAETTVERKAPPAAAVETTLERRHHCVRTVASALHRCFGGLGRTALPLKPLPCVRIGWNAQSLELASAQSL